MSSSESPPSVPRSRRILRLALGAALGSVVLLVAGQAYSALSDTGCALICNPPVALGYGALVGALFAAG